MPAYPVKTSPAPNALAAWERVKKDDAMSIITQPNRIVNEITLAHAVLDRCGCPRRLRGEALTLPERISFLRGRLKTARDAARYAAAVRRSIFVLSREEWKDNIPEEYRILEAKS